ncbi:MAG: TfoX/Sxy family protein [Actinomycetota bacterium]|nr:TfoX/Sxy family protein [Actinomycetota bacterium]
MEPGERFAALVEEFADTPGVAVPERSGRRAFGSDTLRVDGSIFAMMSGGRLVVKLPSHRVAAEIESGAGTPFDGGKGKPMKEWLTVATDDSDTWRALAREALGFMRSKRR